jgi:CheY-like chemotaxis protein/CHASE3 domain sensor protein
MIVPASRSRFTAIVFAALTLIAGNTWFIYHNYATLTELEMWVAHTADVSGTVDRVLMNNLNQTTGVRGFLLTGNRDFIDAFRAGSADLPIALKKLNSLVQDNPVQMNNTQVLGGFVAAMQEQMRNSIAVRSRGPLSRSQIDLNLNDGLEKLNNIRNLVSEMKASEESLLEIRRQAVKDAKRFFVLSILAAALVNAIFILMSFALFKRNNDQVTDQAIVNGVESKTREAINNLSKMLSGDVTTKEVAQVALEFFGTRFNFLASNFYGVQAGDLTLLASFGLGKYEGTSHPSAHALVAEAIKRDTPWMVDEVPEKYWKIRSGLGEAQPQSILFLPIAFQERTFAVLELASFIKITPELVTKASRFTETIGIALNASQSRDILQELLEKSQQQSEELTVQQEELRSNNEELEQQARAMEEQQFSLASKNADLEEVRRELELKAEDLENSSKYKSEFLAKMSHELRTPLNSLLILSTLLIENKEKNLTDRQREFAGSIHNSGQDLLMLINDILDLSKIEAKKLRLKIDSFTIGSVLSAKDASFSIQAKSKGLEFVTETSDDVSKLVVHTDRQRLDQILRNFISNAIKFTEAGKITLKVEQAPNKRVRFSVIDTGVGVDADKLDLIFEAFEQADGSVSRKYGGTGLGLTISRELAGLLEGEIHVASVAGQGSTFSLEIPMKIESFHSASPTLVINQAPRKISETQTISIQADMKKEATELLAKIDRSKTTIVVVEDDPRFRSSVVHAIEEYEFQSVECGSGELALAVLDQFTPSAILLDIKLPEISGFVLLEMIKGRADLRHVPVHIISGLDYQHNALRMGAIGYLTKPVTIEKISLALNRIKSVISGHRRRLLLIEDDTTQSKAITSIIEGKDVDVVAATSGKKALELLRNEAFDCIILDLKLADTSGFQLLEELKSISMSVPPIVIYTGKDLSIEEEEYLRKFSESIIIKGARSPERLLDEVNLFLHRVESLMPQDKRNILKVLRSNEQSFEGKTVLIADDDLRNIFSLTSALENKGMSVRIAKDGVEALQVLEANDDIDLILMDIMMPRMNGYEAMEKIRAHENARIRNLPMIALTAKAMKGDHEKCITAGANDYLPKPLNMDNFTTVLKVWLTRSRVV